VALVAVSTDDAPLAEVVDIRRRYRVGSDPLEVLKGVSLRIEAGDFTAIMGPSGAGKSTLLHILGFLERPTSGEVRFRSRSAVGLDDRELSKLRSAEIGFVFQAFHLIPRLTVRENVEVPLLYRRISLEESRERAERAIRDVGLTARAHHLPSELSGGERQRVAIARALVNDPSLILADEPTGNLDAKTGHDIMELLASVNAVGRAIVVVTHNSQVAAFARKRWMLEDGQILG
jgi:putative ABC transport system ATP-binding protein